MVGDAFALPPTLISDTLANAGTVIGDVWPITALLAGIVLGIAIISWIVSAIRGSSEEE